MQRDEDERSNSTNRISVTNPPCPWKCELTNEAGYVVYSALGSFYIPMFVMLFFYWRIYRAAVRTTRAINQGFRTTKGLDSLSFLLLVVHTVHITCMLVHVTLPCLLACLFDSLHCTFPHCFYMYFTFHITDKHNRKV